jgi:succinate-acetate transporter protein
VSRSYSTAVQEQPATRRPETAVGRAGPGPGPVAAPSALGLYGLFAAAVLYGSNLAGWWGGSGSPILIFPFVAMLGGLAQLVAAVWAHGDRDELTAAVHGVWGAFWLAFGLYQALVTVRRLPVATLGQGVAVDFGMWFVPLAAITAALAVAAAGRSVVLAGTLALLSVASIFEAVAYAGNHGWSLTLSGWLFVGGAALAWGLASTRLIDSGWGGAPTGRRRTRP